MRGLHVATATTVLSALWPEDHVIIDIRDLRATIGLNLAEVVDQGWVDPDSQRAVRPSWPRYQWLRQKVLSRVEELRAAGAEVDPVDVERALYTLDGKTKRSKTSMTWKTYVEALGDALMPSAPS